MKQNKSISDCVFNGANGLFMLFVILVTLYPMWYVIVASFSNPAQLMLNKSLLLKPEGFTTNAYKLVLEYDMVWIGYKNTLIYLFVGTGINMVLTSMGAYVLSRTGYLLKKPFLWFAMFTMFFSGGMIPSYLAIKSYGMMDTIWAMVLPSAISTYNMLVLRTAFSAVPKEMEESAKLDGANDLIILIRIFLPLVVPSLAVVTMFYAIGHWNSWFGAMLYLRTRTKLPLQMVLREILILSQMDYQDKVAVADSVNISEIIKYATIVVATLPILCIYPFMQRFFIKGVMLGAVKG